MNSKQSALPIFLPLLLSAALPLLAQQQPAVKPLSEGELLKTIDSISAPSTGAKSPLGSLDNTRLEPPKPKKGKDSLTQGKPGQTEITSEEGSFDQRTHQAIFTINVHVKSPDFALTSDKLTATMKAQTAKAGAAADANTAKANPPRLTTGNSGVEINATGTPKGPSTDKAGGLEKAVAEGNVVITRERLDADGNVVRDVGRGKKAVYESATGDVTLTGKPEVDQGINSCIAQDEGTIIILNRNGQMKTIGPVKMIIRDNDSGGANGR